ncbi:MAG: MFS transporter [Eubacteriales bacterium]|nr:MFS transporter [Eubacteriales bacterium]
MNSKDKVTLKKVYIAMLFDGLAVSSASVVLPLLRAQYNLQYDFTGLLLAFLSVGNLAAALLCGILPKFIGMKRTALLFIIGMPVGYGLLAVFGMQLILILGFLLIGIAKGASMNNGTVIAGNAAPDRTKSVNMINAMFALGSMLAPFVYAAAMADTLPWWTPIALLAGTGTVLWLFFVSIDFNESRFDKTSPKSENDKNVNKEWAFLKEKHFWLSTALLFGQQCAEISVTGWLVTYYKDQGILSGIISEFTITIIWLAMLAARLFIVFVLPIEKSRNSLTVMSVCSIITYVLMLFADNKAAAVITLFLFGVSIAGIYPTAIAQASKGLSNASVGVQLPIAGIGAIAMPYITGAVAQRIGIRGGMACSVIALIWMLVFAILLRFEERGEK